MKINSNFTMIKKNDKKINSADFVKYHVSYSLKLKY